MLLIKSDNSRIRETSVARILFICLGIAILAAALLFGGMQKEINKSSEQNVKTEIR